MKNIKFYRNVCALALTTSLTLSGCGESTYIPTTANETNTIDTNRDGETTIPSKILPVKRENFKLEVSYTIAPPEGVDPAEFKWRVTNDKNLNIEAHTVDLPEGYKVWIDNVHIDTFVESTNPYFNGILQDSMDDRVHTSLIMGFPIDNDTYYSSSNLISGQDKDFIQGTFWAYEGTGSGDIKQQRYVDADYLKKGVYSNKIGLVYGLLIQGPNDPEPYGMDVTDEVHVLVYNCIEKYDEVKGVINVYTFDSNGNEVLVESYAYEKPKNRKLSE